MTLTVEDFFWLNTLNDTELEQYIQNDLYRPQMTAYFGEEEYESLRELLTDRSRLTLLETEIILLPGIMGSELADETKNKVWVNVKGLVVDGNFLRLQHSEDGTSTGSLKPVGLYFFDPSYQTNWLLIHKLILYIFYNQDSRLVLNIWWHF